MRSGSRLGINQFRLDPFPERRFDGPSRNQIDPRAQQLFQTFRQGNEAKTDGRFHFHQDVDIALAWDLRGAGVGSKEREAFDWKLCLKTGLCFPQSAQDLFAVGDHDDGSLPRQGRWTQLGPDRKAPSFFDYPLGMTRDPTRKILGDANRDSSARPRPATRMLQGTSRSKIKPAKQSSKLGADWADPVPEEQLRGRVLNILRFRSSNAGWLAFVDHGSPPLRFTPRTIARSRCMCGWMRRGRATRARS